MEKFIISEVLTQFEIPKTEDFKVNAIILKTKKDYLPKGSEYSLCGWSLENWVANSVKSFNTTMVDYAEENDPIEVAKKYIKDEDYTIVLYDNTPLLKEKTILDLLDYTQTKRLDICLLPKGFILFSKSVKSNHCYMSSRPNFINQEEFFEVKDINSFVYAQNKLNFYVISCHLKNKVLIEDTSNTFIDVTVKIEEDVRICPFNIIKGDSIIGKGSNLKPNSFIENSVIGKDCEIFHSVIKNSVIKDKTNIGPFKHIENK